MESVFPIIDDWCDRHGVSYIVAHNGARFDKPLLLAEIDRAKLSVPNFREVPWLDTRSDLPYAVEPDSKKLKHLALDCGFINPFSHRALFDVLTMLRIMSTFDFNKIIEYAKIPWIVVRANVGYENRQVAKENRYSWEKLDDKVYPKMWCKKIKATHLEEERKKLEPFKVGVLEGGAYVQSGKAEG